MVGKVGAGITGVSVLVFAGAMLVELVTGVSTASISYVASIFIAIGYVLFASGVVSLGSDSKVPAAGFAGLTFAAIYAVLILIVYFAMLTTVRLNTQLSNEALSLISYEHLGSLFFNYNLLGYGFMSLSTFFVGFTVAPRDKGDRVFRALLRIHGVFFFSCLIMPMTGAFTADTSPAIGMAILLVWCAFFMPVCVLGWRYLSHDPAGFPPHQDTSPR